MQHTSGVHRRAFLMLASGAGVQSWFRLYAGDSEFWNKREPAEWSSDEIQRLTNKSPWAREVTASTPAYTDNSGRSGPGSGTGLPSGGGMGGPGMGGGGGGGMGRMGGGGMGGGGGYGGGRRRSEGGMPMEFKGVVRWESAKPIQDALHTPLPDAFAGHYVISVSGIPIIARGHQNGNDGDGETAVSKAASQDVLDRIKELTYLSPKGKSQAQPGIVQTSPKSANTLLFGFSREMIGLTPEDKEVTFSTQIGRLEIHTKFNLKDMMYHNELAL